VLAEPPTEAHEAVARALGLSRVPSAADYSDVFLFQLYPYASVHLGPEGMMGGEARARVAGFWRALGLEAPEEPDHLSALLGLYATLAENPSPTEDAVALLRRSGRGALLHEHLAPWLFQFAERVAELSRGFYGAWARLLDDVFRTEVEDGAEAGFDPTMLPVHLREAPTLPDPREEGATAFLSGLLAPVRSGLLLARADLARISSELDLGLRAGERRYAMESLLSQDAPGVLVALARESRRQGALHAARVGWLGATARFHADRADRTAELLDDLARQHSTVTTAAAVPRGEGSSEQ